MNESGSEVEYRPVVGFPGYEIGSDGSMYSTRVGGKRKPLKLTIGLVGYRMANLRRDGKTFAVYVHHLVLVAFVGPKPDGCEALHNDGCRTNNKRENLRWGTRSENVQDALRHGTMLVGEMCPSAKITESDVREIRASSETNVALAIKYGIKDAQVSRIRSKQRWKHVA